MKSIEKRYGVSGAVSGQLATTSFDALCSIMGNGDKRIDGRYWV